MTPCTPRTRVRIISMHDRSPKRQLSGCEISRSLQVPKSSVHDIIQKWRQRGTMERQSGSSRPPVLSDQAQERLIRAVRREPKLSADVLPTKREFQPQLSDASSKATGWNQEYVAEKLLFLRQTRPRGSNGLLTMKEPTSGRSSSRMSWPSRLGKHGGRGASRSPERITCRSISASNTVLEQLSWSGEQSSTAINFLATSAG